MSTRNKLWQWLPAAVLACAPVMAGAAEPWTTQRVERSAQKAANKPHILLLHDMEGLSGQDDPDSFLFGSKTYPKGRELLTADVNAVVRGLIEGGAGSISVVDGHGSGNPEPDVLRDKLDSRAALLMRDEFFDPYVDLPKLVAFDAVVVVGMHARSGSGGFAAHCLTIGVETRVGAHSLNETELVALLYGEAGVPVIFASGDDKLQGELQASMPWIRTVVTKYATSPSSARLIPVAQVHERLTREARSAMQKLPDARVVRATAPVPLSVHAVPPANMKWLANMPGVNYHDETVSFTAPSFTAGYRGVEAVVRAASFSFESAMKAPVANLPNADELEFAGLRELVRRWLDAEAKVPVPPAAPKKARQHNGFN